MLHTHITTCIYILLGSEFYKYKRKIAGLDIKEQKSREKREKQLT